MTHGERDGVSATEELRISEERHRLLAEHANDVIWTMSVDGRITYVSPAVEAMRGITPAEAMAQPIERIHPPESAAVSLGYFTELYRRLEQGLPPHEFRGELEYFRHDGSTVWCDVQVIPHLDAAGHLVEILGVSRDLTERKEHEAEMRRARDELAAANEELSRLAITDDLTGVWNRRHTTELAEAELRRHERTGEPVALLLVDLDRFKQVNDRWGHAIGDEVLADAARALRGAVREIDVLGRWGGEEFLVVAPGASLGGARELAERLRAAVAEDSARSSHPVTTSIGVAVWAPGESLLQTFARADAALYRAKERGRDQVCD